MSHCALGVALLAACGLLTVGSGEAAAQSLALRSGDRFAAEVAGASFFTELGPHFAMLRDRQVVLASFQRERMRWVGTRFALASTMEIPLAMVMPTSTPTVCWLRRTTLRKSCFAVLRPGDPVYAAGLTPFGARLYYGSERAVRLFGGLAAGVVLFDRNTPVEDASALNFAAESQLGAEFALRGGRSALTVAWKFQHWSNANTSAFNPGLDVNFFTVGLKRRLARDP